MTCPFNDPKCRKHFKGDIGTNLEIVNKDDKIYYRISKKYKLCSKEEAHFCLRTDRNICHYTSAIQSKYLFKELSFPKLNNVNFKHYNDYLVYENGLIFSKKHWKFMKFRKVFKTKYLRVQLLIENVKKCLP